MFSTVTFDNPNNAPIGANANFVSVDPDGTLRVRTFEKGVEAETLACGTGITASAIAAYLVAEDSHRVPCSTTPARTSATAPIRYDIQARIARLAVDFRPEGDHFTDVYLTGPADEIR